MNHSTKKTRVKDAFHNNYNRIALAAVFSLSVALLNPVPLEIGIALELLYLLAVGLRPSPSSENAKVASPSASANALLMPRPKGASLQSGLNAETILPQLRVELQEKYYRMEGAYGLIQVQLAGKPSGAEMVHQLNYLKGKFLVFAQKEEELRDQLHVLVEEAKRLDSNLHIFDTQEGARRPYAHLVLTAEDNPLGDTTDRWVQQMIQQAHECYERELQEVGQQRQSVRNKDAESRLERRAYALLRRSKYADKIGKLLINLEGELELLAKKFEMTASEMPMRSLAQILADINALVVQTDSMTRTLDDLEAFSDIHESVAA